MSDDEVTYHYVKGQGWVPRLGPEPEPETTGWTGVKLEGVLGYDGNLDGLDDAFYRRMREHREEIERLIWQDARWAAPVRDTFRVTTTTAAPRPREPMIRRQDEYVNRYYGRFGTYYGRFGTATVGGNTDGPDETEWYTHANDDLVWGQWNERNTRQQPERPPANPEDIREMRYYPGANVAPEPVRAENQHERRAREYREELERARNRREAVERRRRGR